MQSWCLQGLMPLFGLQKPGELLASKLKWYLRPKCHALLLDCEINSSLTVKVNIYQVAPSPAHESPQTGLDH